MPLFNNYIMVDWSAGNRRRAGRRDCIWIAHGDAASKSPETVSPPSRTEAEQILRSLLQRTIASREARVLLCADFGYGYPAGFVTLLPKPVPNNSPPWRIVWQYLKKQVQDDLETLPGQKPTNRSNRFKVASDINCGASTPAVHGPFWCLFTHGAYPCVPQKQPPQPFRGTIGPLRITDERAGSDTPFRLFGTGSVGSQVLTGIPRLERLRFDPQFAQCSAVWPFETGWAPATVPWPERAVRVLHAEIYPSVRKPLADPINDRGQVRAMWHWARDLDAKDMLVREFEIPPGIECGSRNDKVIRSEEGWILGCPC